MNAQTSIPTIEVMIENFNCEIAINCGSVLNLIPYQLLEVIEYQNFVVQRPVTLYLINDSTL